MTGDAANSTRGKGNKCDSGKPGMHHNSECYEGFSPLHSCLSGCQAMFQVAHFCAGTYCWHVGHYVSLLLVHDKLLDLPIRCDFVQVQIT